MGRIKRAILFGSLSGLLWTFAPFWFSSQSLDNLKLFVPAGVLTGVLISLAICKPLLTSRPAMTVLWGVLALLLSALVFGFCVGLFQTIIGYADGANSGTSHNPLVILYMGVMYFSTTLFICLKPLYALILCGSAVLTTWLLRWWLRYRTNPPQPL